MRSRAPSSFGVAAVERADPDRDGDIERGLSGLQHQIFGGDLTQRETSRREFVFRCCAGLCNRFAGTINGKHVSLADPPDDLTGRGARTAANLQNPNAWSKRQRIYDLEEPRR
jgi:hypothetical protein